MLQIVLSFIDYPRSVNYDRTTGVSFVACTVIILQSSYDNHHEWRLNYKCVAPFALAIAFAVASAWVVNYAPRVIVQIVVSFSYYPRGVIYDRKMFIVQTTGRFQLSIFLLGHPYFKNDRKIIVTSFENAIPDFKLERDFEIFQWFWKKKLFSFEKKS